MLELGYGAKLLSLQLTVVAISDSTLLDQFAELQLALDQLAEDHEALDQLALDQFAELQLARPATWLDQLRVRRVAARHARALPAAADAGHDLVAGSPRDPERLRGRIAFTA